MTMRLYNVIDDEGCPTNYYIDSNTEPYFNAYELVDDQIKRIARIRKWHNNIAPFENLNNGVMYDSIEWLCYNATKQAA